MEWNVQHGVEGILSTLYAIGTWQSSLSCGPKDVSVLVISKTRL